MATLPPLDVSFLAHGGDPALLARTLLRTLGEARPLVVLQVATVDSPAMLAAAVEAFRPDAVAMSGDLAPAIEGFLPRRVVTLGDDIWCPAPLHPLVALWESDFADRMERRRGTVTRYGVADLVTFGFPADDLHLLPAAARLGSGRTGTLLLPGCGTSRVRVAIHLLRAASDIPRLRIDGYETTPWLAQNRVCATADIAPAACHVVEVTGCAAGETAIVAVEIGPG